MNDCPSFSAVRNQPQHPLPTARIGHRLWARIQRRGAQRSNSPDANSPSSCSLLRHHLRPSSEVSGGRSAGTDSKIRAALQPLQSSQRHTGTLGRSGPGRRTAVLICVAALAKLFAIPLSILLCASFRTRNLLTAPCHGKIGLGWGLHPQLTTCYPTFVAVIHCCPTSAAADPSLPSLCIVCHYAKVAASISRHHYTTWLPCRPQRDSAAIQLPATYSGGACIALFCADPQEPASLPCCRRRG